MSWLGLQLMGKMGSLGHGLDTLLLDEENLLENWMLIGFSPISDFLETPPGHRSMIRSRSRASRLDIV